MKFNKELTSIHAYLCADGYVIRNPPTQKHKYYVVGFRNQNITLLKDFQLNFYKQFNHLPKLRKDGRCVVNSKELYYKITQEFGSFYSKDWNMPNLDSKYLKYWLRAFFDCEAWVTAKKAKDRQVAVDSINYKGLKQISKALKILNIKTKLRENKGRNTYRLHIYGKDNIIRYQEKIGFLHKEKKIRLKKAVDSYINYYWDFPKDNNKLKNFIKKIFHQKAKVKSPYIVRIVSNKEDNFLNLKKYLLDLYKIESKLYNQRNGQGTLYFSLMIQKKEETKKLIKKGLLTKKERNKINPYMLKSKSF